MEVTEGLARPRELAEAVADLDRLDVLAELPRAGARAVLDLLDDGADVLAVSRGVADVHDLLTGRLVALAQRKLGPPPFDYTWLALGSHGRGELVPSSDQDSALVYGGPRRCGGDPQGYFARLAAPVVDALAVAGVPRCSGGYMATSWCHSLERFTGLFRDWVADPEPGALLRVEVFLDLRPVHGGLDVGALEQVLVRGREQHSFLVQMARAAVSFRPALSWLGRLRTDHGMLDVKRSGTAAVVLLARLYALAAGSAAHSTADRLAAAERGGTLGRADVAALTDAFRVFAGLRLRHQAGQVLQGQRPGNRVDVRTLPGQERERLRSAMRAVAHVQELTRVRYAVHMVV